MPLAAAGTRVCPRTVMRFPALALTRSDPANHERVATRPARSSAPAAAAQERRDFHTARSNVLGLKIQA